MDGGGSDDDAEFNQALLRSKLEWEEAERQRRALEEALVAQAVAASSQQQQQRPETPQPFLGMRTSNNLRASRVPPSAPPMALLALSRGGTLLDPVGVAPSAPDLADLLPHLITDATPFRDAPLPPVVGAGNDNNAPRVSPNHLAMMGLERRVERSGHALIYLDVVSLETKVASDATEISVTLGEQVVRHVVKSPVRRSAIFWELLLSVAGGDVNSTNVQLAWGRPGRDPHAVITVSLAPLVLARTGVCRLSVPDNASEGCTIEFTVTENVRLAETAIRELPVLRVVTQRVSYAAGEAVVGVVSFTCRGEPVRVEAFDVAVHGGVSSHKTNAFDWFGLCTAFARLKSNEFISPGIHAYRFSFTLPAAAPPTAGFLPLPTMGVRCTYAVEARVVKSKKPKAPVLAMRELRVFRRSHDPEPGPATAEGNFAGPVLNRGSISIQATVRNPCLSIGDALDVEIVVSSTCKRVVNGGVAFVLLSAVGCGNGVLAPGPAHFRLGPETSLGGIAPNARRSIVLRMPVEAPQFAKIVVPDASSSFTTLRVVDAASKMFGEIRVELVVEAGSARLCVPLLLRPDLFRSEDPVVQLLPLDAAPAFDHVVNVDSLMPLPILCAPTDLRAPENGWALDSGLEFCASTSSYACPELTQRPDLSGDGLAKINWAVNRNGRWQN